MKLLDTKIIKNDDSLFGLLSLYKANNTYIRILVSEAKIVVQLTDNPGKWFNISEERYKNFRILRRLEIGISKISLKYLTPENLVKIIGPMLGIKIPSEKAVIINNLSEGGCYILETSIKYKMKVLHGLKKIFNLTPQKRYEILEKYLALDQD